MKKLLLILTIGVFTGILTACATVMRENNQAVPIKANIEKVDIKITNKAGEVVLRGKHQQF